MKFIMERCPQIFLFLPRSLSLPHKILADIRVIRGENDPGEFTLHGSKGGAPQTNALSLPLSYAASLS